MGCCEDIQRLMHFITFLYEQASNLSTLPTEAEPPTFNSHAQPSTSTSTSDPLAVAGHPFSFLSPTGRSKIAPKLKPRKGVNVSLRGGRLGTSLEEYTAWCRNNKLAWSGNQPQSTITAWFQAERIRKTFCCCVPLDPRQSEASQILKVDLLQFNSRILMSFFFFFLNALGPAELAEDALKIRFPASAIKLIRRHDKLQLEVKKSDDGSEWNIFQYLDSDLYPGDESDEDDSFYNVSGGDKTSDTEIIQSLSKEKRIDLDQAKALLTSRRLMRQQIEAGDYEDDGFESKVPPKGGKQAFR